MVTEKTEDNRNLNHKEPNLEKITIREAYGLNIHIPFLHSLVKIRINETKWIDPGWRIGGLQSAGGGGFIARKGVPACRSGLQQQGGLPTCNGVAGNWEEASQASQEMVLHGVKTVGDSCPNLGVVAC